MASLEQLSYERYVSHRATTLRVATRSISGEDATSPSLSSEDTSLVRQRVRTEGFHLIHALETAGELTMNDEGRARLVAAFAASPDMQKIAQFAGLPGPETVSLTQLYDAYQGIMPRLTAKSLLDGTGPYGEEPELLTAFGTVLRIGLSEEQQELLEVAGEMQEEFRGDNIGILKDAEDASTPERVEIMERNGGIMGVLVHAPTRQEVDILMSQARIQQFDSHETLRDFLAAVPNTEPQGPSMGLITNPSDDPFGGGMPFGRGMPFPMPMPPFPGGPRGRGRGGSRGGLAAMLGGMLGGEEGPAPVQLGIIVVGPMQFDADSTNAHSRIMGGQVGGMEIDYHTHSEVPPKQEEVVAHPFDIEQPDPVIDPMSMRPAVPVFDGAVRQGSHVYLLSSNMMEGIRHASMPRRGGPQDRLRDKLYEMLGQHDQLISMVCHIKGLSAQERLMVLREIAAVGLRRVGKPVEHLTGIFYQTADQQAV